MTRVELHQLAESLNKVDNFYESEFVKIIQGLIRDLLEKNLSDLSANRPKKHLPGSGI